MKDNVLLDARLCRQCLLCQLVCSLYYTGSCNVHAARIKVASEGVEFTPECLPNCHICAGYCPYGALREGSR